MVQKAVEIWAIEVLAEFSTLNHTWEPIKYNPTVSESPCCTGFPISKQAAVFTSKYLQISVVYLGDNKDTIRTVNTSSFRKKMQLTTS